MDRGRFAERLRNDIAPQARSIDITWCDAATGRVSIRMTLPTRTGEARVVIRRFDGERDRPPGETPQHQRWSGGGSNRWNWFIDYDEREISAQEVLVLLGRPLGRDPVLSCDEMRS